MNTQHIRIETAVSAPADMVWSSWTDPGHIIRWNHASPDWHTPHAENDLRPGGKFLYRMEARDASAGFDFWGIYDHIEPGQMIRLTLGDGRKVSVEFETVGQTTFVRQAFEPEDQNSIELQKMGWQAILDNFRQYTESLYSEENHG